MLKRHVSYNKELRDRARELRKNMTPAEKCIWYNVLRDFPCRVHRQKIIGNYIVDFYIAQYKLIIEIDGPSHETQYNERHDKIRTEFLESLGLKVIRFWNSEVLHGYVDIEKTLYNVCR